MGGAGHLISDFLGLWLSSKTLWGARLYHYPTHATAKREAPSWLEKSPKGPCVSGRKGLHSGQDPHLQQ